METIEIELGFSIQVRDEIEPFAPLLSLMWATAVANAASGVCKLPTDVVMTTVSTLPTGDTKLHLAELAGSALPGAIPIWLWPGSLVAVRYISWDGSFTRWGKILEADPQAGTVTAEEWSEDCDGNVKGPTSTATYSLQADGQWMSDHTSEKYPEYTNRSYLHAGDGETAAALRLGQSRDRLRHAFDEASKACYSPGPTMDSALEHVEAAIADIRTKGAAVLAARAAKIR